MMGHTHALSGAAGFLAATPVVEWVAGPLTPTDLVAGAVVAAGAAMLPDLDHHDSSAANTFGWPTRILCAGIERISGGHRHATHSLIGLAVVAALTWLASHDLVATVAVVTLTVGLGVRALGWTRDGVPAAIGTFTVAGLGAWLLVTHGTTLAWLPAACTIGAAAHLIGDSCTDGGVPWLWPADWRATTPVTVTTGGLGEKLIAAVLGPVAFGLVVWRTGTWPIIRAAGGTLMAALHQEGILA